MNQNLNLFICTRSCDPVMPSQVWVTNSAREWEFMSGENSLFSDGGDNITVRNLLFAAIEVFHIMCGRLSINGEVQPLAKRINEYTDDILEFDLEETEDLEATYFSPLCKLPDQSEYNPATVALLNMN